jgi:hypothetical protein
MPTIEHTRPLDATRRTAWATDQQSRDASLAKGRAAAVRHLRAEFAALVGEDIACQFLEVDGPLACDDWTKFSLVLVVGTGRRVEVGYVPGRHWLFRAWRPATPTRNGHWCGVATTDREAKQCFDHGLAWASGDDEKLVMLDREEGEAVEEPERWDGLS